MEPAIETHWRVPSGRVVAALATLAAVLAALGRPATLPSWALALALGATVAGLFVFESGPVRIHRDALAWGMLPVFGALFHGVVGSGGLRSVAAESITWHGLEALVHADTLLFLLGLTLFVAVVAQSRGLDAVAFGLLKHARGSVQATAVVLYLLVAALSGVVGGVSMVGLLLRTLVLVLTLAGATTAALRESALLATVVTTVCGSWLTYGEPPNLIMKANVRGADGIELLTDGFFLAYCLPACVGVFALVAWRARRAFEGLQVDHASQDFVERHAPFLAFLREEQHGGLPRAWAYSALGFVALVAGLALHAREPRVPLPAPPFAAAAVALLGLRGLPKLRALAWRSAKAEALDYTFLVPLFVGVALLGRSGFFAPLRETLRAWEAHPEASAVAQFGLSTALSAVLDNNVVADFGSRALQGLDPVYARLYAMAQLLGYALGGCWTHLGSAQSVVAFAFVVREVDKRYTPLRWLREATPMLLQAALVLLTALTATTLWVTWR
ncbi:MAG: hypothetical protein HY909_04955 [Deltaproteobacteria bacterium]|nr:hypothetical protein [Deltaproteobacteria bacterium]